MGLAPARGAAESGSTTRNFSTGLRVGRPEPCEAHVVQHRVPRALQAWYTPGVKRHAGKKSCSVQRYKSTQACGFFCMPKGLCSVERTFLPPVISTRIDTAQSRSSGSRDPLRRVFQVFVQSRKGAGGGSEPAFGTWHGRDLARDTLVQYRT
eukprot:2006244-Rhodomonas_salina.1